MWLEKELSCGWSYMFCSYPYSFCWSFQLFFFFRLFLSFVFFKLIFLMFFYSFLISFSFLSSLSFSPSAPPLDDWYHWVRWCQSKCKSVMDPTNPTSPEHYRGEIKIRKIQGGKYILVNFHGTTPPIGKIDLFSKITLYLGNTELQLNI